MNIIKLILLGSTLITGGVFAADLKCSDRFSYASVDGINCSDQTVKLNNAKMEGVRVKGLHVNDWKINSYYIKRMTISGKRGEKFTQALDSYLQKNISYSKYSAMKKKGELYLNVRDNSFSCKLNSQVCMFTDLNFDEETGKNRASFYYRTGLERSRSDLGYLNSNSARVAIDIQEFESVLHGENLCNDFFTFRYGRHSNSMCVLEFNK